MQPTAIAPTLTVQSHINRIIDKFKRLEILPKRRFLKNPYHYVEIHGRWRMDVAVGRST